MEYIYLVILLITVFVLTFLYQKLIFSRKKPFIKILPLIIFIGTISFLSFLNLEKSDNSNILKPIGRFVEKNLKTDKKSEELEKIIQKEIQDTEGTYAVTIKNLKTHEYYYYNEEKLFETASLYKLWVMGAIYEEIEKGNLSLDKEIGFDAQTINERLDIASESAEITESFVGNTVEGALERMITISDNYSAHILYLTTGWGKVGNFLEKYGFKNSSTDKLQTTAFDIMSFYEKLYNGEIVSKSASTEMIEILKRQQLNDRIPKYLPENVETAHKTGELGAVKHDAGIVYSPKGDYIIVLLSETNNQTTASEIEAKISEKVWKYFN